MQRSPSLLASSVGKDVDGRLVPSSSTISLLSLGFDQCAIEDEDEEGPDPNPVSRRSSNVFRGTPSQHISHQRHHHYQSAATSNRKHSMTKSSPRLIPIKTTQDVPDSPCLDPTSLGNSPSGFWLASQTPPASFRKPSFLNMTQRIKKPDLGNTSPRLLPLNTPTEPPMTPLMLSISQREDAEPESDTNDTLDQHDEASA